MKNVSAARRYARALFELSTASKVVDDVLQGLSNLNQAMTVSDDFKKAMLSPLVKPEEKEALAKTVSSNKVILRFVFLLAKRKRVDLLEIIYECFLEMTDLEKGIKRVSVKTAMTLTESQKKKVETDLAGSLGGTVIGQFDVSKDLIGGVWIQMGDKVLDASLKGRFDDLRHALVHSAN